MASFFLNHQFLIDAQKTIENARRYIFTRHRRLLPKHHNVPHHNIPHHNIPHHDNTPFYQPYIKTSERQKFMPFKVSKSLPLSNTIELDSFTVNNSKVSVDKVYPLKVTFSESMYRVMIHDNGLDCMFNPDRYLTLAVPTVKRAFAKRIIQNAMQYKKAIVITVPLDEAIFYMKKLQLFSFTVTLTEA
jgi:hypothetical protein